MGTARRKRLTGPMSKRLRTAREDAGLSRAQLAEITGLSPKTIFNYEDPSYARNRKAAFVRSWADGTGRTFEDLWGGPLGQGIVRTGWLRDFPERVRVA